MRRPEEALPVAAVLAVGGNRPQRGAALHAASRRTAAEDLLVEKRLAPRDDRRRSRFRVLAGRQPDNRRLRAVRRRAPAPRRGRIEASGQLLVRRRESRREEGQRTGGAHRVR